VSAGRAKPDECRENGDEQAAQKFDAADNAQAWSVWWAGLPLGRGVELIAHDANGVAALCKPAGLLSHPNAAGDEARSLLRAPYDLREECYTLGEGCECGLTDTGQQTSSTAHAKWRADVSARAPKKSPRLFLLNRLDSATSGLLLVCANRELALKIRQRFRERAVHKVYAALVFGKLGQAAKGGAAPLIWRDRLTIEKRGGQIRTKAATRAKALAETGAGARLAASARVSSGGGRGAVTAETRVKVLRVGQGVSLLQLEPLTGRSHQLRVQCARRGLPIVGDGTYGDFAANRVFSKAHHGTRGRLFLHSLETRFDYEWRGRKTHFAARAPLPEEFGRLVSY